MTKTKSVDIEIVSSKAFARPIRGPICWCPSTYMFLAPLSNGSLTVYRSNGQVVWTRFGRPNASVVHVEWKPNGSLVAVVFSDGFLQYFLATNGRLMYTSTSPHGRVHSIHWGGLHASVVEQKLRAATKHLSVETRSVLLEPDLILKQMPRPSSLSVLPSDVGNDFWKLGLVDEDINTKDLSISAIIYDRGVEFCLCGILPLPLIQFDNELQDNNSVHITFSTDLTRCLATQKNSSSTASESIGISEFSLEKLLDLSSKDIVMTVAQIKAHLEYNTTVIKQTCDDINAADKAMRTFLEKSNVPVDEFRAHLFDFLIVGGHPKSEVANWMEVAHEKGFKTWLDKVNKSYDSAKRNLLASVIPACERLCVLMSKLRGKLIFDRDMCLIDFESEQFLDAAIKKVGEIHKLADRALWGINADSMYFKGFSKWIGKCFETALSRPLMPRNQPGSLKKETLDAVKTLDVCEYLTNYLLQSRVNAILGLPDAKLEENQDSNLTQVIDETSKVFQNVYADVQNIFAQRIERVRVANIALEHPAQDLDVAPAQASDGFNILATLKAPDDQCVVTLINVDGRGNLGAGRLNYPAGTKSAKLINNGLAAILRSSTVSNGRPASNATATLETFELTKLKLHTVAPGANVEQSFWKDLPPTLGGIVDISQDIEQSAGSIAISGAIQDQYYGCLVSSDLQKFTVWTVAQ